MKLTVKNIEEKLAYIERMSEEGYRKDAIYRRLGVTRQAVALWTKKLAKLKKEGYIADEEYEV